MLINIKCTSFIGIIRPEQTLGIEPAEGRGSVTQVIYENLRIHLASVFVPPKSLAKAGGRNGMWRKGGNY